MKIDGFKVAFFLGLFGRMIANKEKKYDRKMNEQKNAKLKYHSKIDPGIS